MAVALNICCHVTWGFWHTHFGDPAGTST